jgi:hypothetical protein
VSSHGPVSTPPRSLQEGREGKQDEVRGNDRTFQYVVGFFAAVFLLGIIGASVLGNKPVDQPTTLAPSSIAVSSTTTTVATTISVDPHVGRPVYDEFLILSVLDSETAQFCRESFGSDTAACYDAYELGTDNFEEVIVRNLEARTSSIPSYPSDQYGCHSDGRCLDDYGLWCDESEFESFEDEYGDTVNLCYPDL